jgi:methionyl-tRNA formyltransferase
MKIQVLCDNPHSWMNEYAKEFTREISIKGYDAVFIEHHEEIVKGDILILLSCEKIFKKLHLNRHNLVVHESNLPQGKGWSPLTWQVIEGKKQIPITLFEAVEVIDSGPIYGQIMIELTGLELIEELRHKQAMATMQLLNNFLSNYPNNPSNTQKGEETFYPKRTKKDSELNIDKSIAEQFDLLRICDNERYPAYFIKDETKYILKIYKAND